MTERKFYHVEVLGGNRLFTTLDLAKSALETWLEADKKDKVEYEESEDMCDSKVTWSNGCEQWFRILVFVVQE